MSDITPTSAAPAAAPVTSPAPSSSPAPVATSDTSVQTGSSTPDTSSQPDLESRIGAAIKSLDQPEPPSDPDAIETHDEPQQEDIAQAEQTPPVVDDPLAQELGIDPSKYNRIPYHKVQKIIENKLAAQAQEYEAYYGEQIGQFQEAFRHVDEKFQAYKATEDVMSTNPQQFLQALAQADPRYAQLLGPLFGQVGGFPQQGGFGQQYADPSMPQPDLDLGDGNRTYSEQGFQQRLAWERQQAVQEAEQRILQQFEPILAEKRTQRAIEAAVPQVEAQLQEAQTWPLFNENADEITAVLTANPRASLQQAYQHVVYPKLQVDRDRMRKEILAEIGRQPKSTSVTPTAPTKRTDDGDDLDARILKAIKSV